MQKTNQMKIILTTLSFLLIGISPTLSQYKFKDEKTWKEAYRVIELARNDKCDDALLIFETLSADTLFGHRSSIIAIANCLRELGEEEKASELVDHASSLGFIKRSISMDSITHPDISKRLLMMYLEDQGAWSLKDKFIIDPGVREQLINGGVNLDALSLELRRMPGLELHKLHVKELEEIIEEYGFPTEQMVGRFGLKGVKFVILHSKKDLLEKYKNDYKRTFGSYMYAYLTDKIRVANNEKQLYGTQGDFDENKKMIFYPIEDEINVNKRRMVAGMEPLEMYAKNLGVMGYKVPVQDK